MNIAFKALVGSHNYNLNNKISDKDYKVFYYPTFEDLYNGDKTSKHKTSIEMDIEYHDIRKLPDMLWKSNVNFIEVLFSQEVEYNCSLYQELYEVREEIASMNLPYLWDACYGMIYQKLKDAKREIDKEDNKKAGKSLYQVARINEFLIDYAYTDFTNFAGSIYFVDHNLKNSLMNIKTGKVEVGSLYDMYSSHLKIDKKMELKNKYKSMERSDAVNKKVRDIVKKHVTEKIYAELQSNKSL